MAQAHDVVHEEERSDVAQIRCACGEAYGSKPAERCEVCMIADQDGGLSAIDFQTAKGKHVATLKVCSVCILMAQSDRFRVTKDTLAVIKYIANRHTYIQHTRRA